MDSCRHWKLTSPTTYVIIRIGSWTTSLHDNTIHGRKQCTITNNCQRNRKRQTRRQKTLGFPRFTCETSHMCPCFFFLHTHSFSFWSLSRFHLRSYSSNCRWLRLIILRHRGTHKHDIDHALTSPLTAQSSHMWRRQRDWTMSMSSLMK